MSYVTGDRPQGILGRGWTALVGDYAIAGGWALGGKVFAVADSAGGVFAFEHKTGDTQWSREEVHDGGVMALAIHPDGKLLATAGQDGRVVIWNAADGQILADISIENAWIENLAWSHNGRWLAASAGRRVHVHSVGGEPVWASKDHPSTVSAVAWSKSNELATACYGQVSFFDVATGDTRQTLRWKGSLVSMALSPDGDVVACGSQDNTVHFWRRSTGEDSLMSGYPGKPSAMTFDRKGTLLATNGATAVTVWSFHGDGPEGTTPGRLLMHAHPVTQLAFERKGMRLASGSRDGAVVVWSVEKDGRGTATGAAALGDAAAGLYWRPDGSALAALDAQGGVTVFKVRHRFSSLLRG